MLNTNLRFSNKKHKPKKGAVLKKNGSISIILVLKIMTYTTCYISLMFSISKRITTYENKKHKSRRTHSNIFSRQKETKLTIYFLGREDTNAHEFFNIGQYFLHISINEIFIMKKIS